MTKTLLHTGFAKAGSTFLQEWFDRHPQLHFATNTLAGFDSVFAISDLVHERPNAGYRYFVTSNELLGSGGRIPYGWALYSFRMLRDVDLRRGQRDICRILRDVFPGSWVIVVTRGFEDVIRSLYSQYVKAGGAFTFRGFLDAYTPILLQWLDFDYNVELYRNAFGDDHMIVLPYELLKRSPDTFLGVIERQLGLDHLDEFPGVSNPSLRREQLYWYALVSRYLVTPLADVFKPAIAARIYRFYGGKMVQRNRLGNAIRLVNTVFRRSADLSYPDGYLDQFRGMADSLAPREEYQPFLGEYLIDTAGVPGYPAPSPRPASLQAAGGVMGVDPDA